MRAVLKYIISFMTTNKRKPRIIRACTVDTSLGFVEPVISTLKVNYDVQMLASPGSNIKRISNEYGVAIHEIFMHRRISPLKDIISLVNIIRVLRKERPDIIHSMTPKAGLLCMLAAWLMNVPTRIHTFTGLVWPTMNGVSKKILMFTDWITCTCATHIIPEGKGVMNDLQNYITNKPMRVLGFGNVKGVDMSTFSKRDEILEKSRAIRNDNIFTFLFVGRIVGDKGINELVESFVKINKHYPNTRLILVGNMETSLDPLLPKTLELMDNKCIEFIGPKFKDDLIVYYAASDCLVFPSYREGFPNVVLEAGAMDLPCIVTDINGSREIIENGVNGYVIPPKNVSALYDSMAAMINDPVIRKNMVSNARPLIEARYEQGFVQKCLLDFYSEILNS